MWLNGWRLRPSRSSGAHAKDSDGNPVVISIGPDEFAELTTVGNATESQSDVPEAVVLCAKPRVRKMLVRGWPGSVTLASEPAAGCRFRA